MLTPETPSLTSGDGDEPLLLVIALVVRRSYVASVARVSQTKGDPQLSTRVMKATEANEVKTENRVRGVVVYCALFLTLSAHQGAFYDHDGNVSYDRLSSLELVPFICCIQ